MAAARARHRHIGGVLLDDYAEEPITLKSHPETLIAATPERLRSCLHTALSTLASEPASRRSRSSVCWRRRSDRSSPRRSRQRPCVRRGSGCAGWRVAARRRRQVAPPSSSISHRWRAGPTRNARRYTRPLYTAKGAKEAALGVIKVESDTRVAVDQRLVSFSDFTIAESNFPTSSDGVKAVVSEITTSVPLDERVIALDRVLANVDTSQIIPKNVEGVKADPPTIFFSQTPAASSSSTVSRCGHRFRRTTCDRRSTPTGISSSTRHPRPTSFATSGRG